MRILLIEDDPKIASFVIKGLKQAGFVVDHCDDGDAGADRLRDEPYDVAVVDIMLPGRDGVSLVRGYRADGGDTPILFLSAKREVDDRVKGLQAGGDDYLTKPFAFAELLARIQALLRRSSGAGEPTLLQVGELRMDLLKRTIHREGKRIELHTREFALLEYLMRNPGRVISKTMIMEHVWNYDFDPQTNIVETCICRLRTKLNEGFSENLIRTVRGAGYVLGE